MSAQNDRSEIDKLLQPFGISAQEAEVVNPTGEMRNGISDEEIELLAKPYGKAIQDRLKEAAILFNLELFINKIDTPWRCLIDEFRDDLECTTELQPLLMPDGTQQMVIVDSGTYPGHPKLRESLWKLHEILDEIENYKATDHINSHVAKAFGQQGGSPAIHDDEKILKLILEIVRSNSSNRQMKGSEIFILVQAKLARLKLPTLGKTKFYELLNRAKQDPR